MFILIKIYKWNVYHPDLQFREKPKPTAGNHSCCGIWELIRIVQTIQQPKNKTYKKLVINFRLSFEKIRFAAFYLLNLEDLGSVSIDHSANLGALLATPKFYNLFCFMTHLIAHISHLV